MTDAELIDSILRGNVRAFEVLMHRNKRTLLRTASAILRDEAEAEDAVQEAFLQAYGALGTFRGESKLSTWLVRITVNEALMRRRCRVNAPIDATADTDRISIAPGPESNAVQGEMRSRLEERIETLPDEYQAVFRLRALEEFTVGETAAALGIPAATVRTRYFRARSLLRESMAQEFDKRPSLPPIFITEKDRVRLTILKPHAALLRELDRAVVISPKAAILAHAVTMNTQVLYTDETTSMQRLVNIVFPHEEGGCVCTVSILAPVGSALIGLSAGQAIEWDFPDGIQHRLRVDDVIRHDCPVRASSKAVLAYGTRN